MRETERTPFVHRARSGQSRQAFGDDHAPRSVNAMNLKNMLGQIKANGRDRRQIGDKLSHGWRSFRGLLNDNQLGTILESRSSGRFNAMRVASKSTAHLSLKVGITLLNAVGGKDWPPFVNLTGYMVKSRGRGSRQWDCFFRSTVGRSMSCHS
jgi:hypothetical protein